MSDDTPSPDLRRFLEATLRFAAGSGAWITRAPLHAPPEAPTAEPPAETTGAAGLAAIREDIGDCRRCRLCERRTRIVFGVGSSHARILFVGEGPGAEEDKVGEPFVGPAGQLLDRMIAAIGYAREEVYIANVVKCRPPGNRDPWEDEVATCLPFLWRQIEAVRPRVVCALGAHAARALLGTESPISSLRGKPATVRGFTVVPTYHPAFLLRNPDAKKAAWEDLKKVRELAREP